MTSPRAIELINRLALHRHPEGGWYREIYRSATRLETPHGSRSSMTTTYYLLEQNQVSRWHVLQSDEIWHFYAGEPLELLAYSPVTRTLARHELSETSVAVIPKGVWQAARSRGDYTLMGSTVGPGFEFADLQFVVRLPSHQDHFKGALAPFAHLL